MDPADAEDFDDFEDSAMALEDDFDEAWATWIDQAVEWEPFFKELHSCTPDLASELQRLDLVDIDGLLGLDPEQVA